MTADEIFQRFEHDPDAFIRIPTAMYRLQLGPQMIPVLPALVKDVLFK